jgi:hypothetical protein
MSGKFSRAALEEAAGGDITQAEFAAAAGCCIGTVWNHCSRLGIRWQRHNAAATKAAARANSARGREKLARKLAAAISDNPAITRDSLRHIAQTPVKRMQSAISLAHELRLLPEGWFLPGPQHRGAAPSAGVVTRALAPREGFRPLEFPPAIRELRATSRRFSPDLVAAAKARRFSPGIQDDAPHATAASLLDLIAEMGRTWPEVRPPAAFNGQRVTIDPERAGVEASQWMSLSGSHAAMCAGVA